MNIEYSPHLDDVIIKLDIEGLDEGISKEVAILIKYGIETFESCEGGIGHAFFEPTVRFHGDKSEGFKALAIAMQNDLKPSKLRRIWDIIDNEPIGAYWEMTFTK